MEGRIPTLKEFVSEAIKEIAEGLNEAQENGRDKGIKIYPESYEDSSVPMKIEFDLSVTTITQDKSESGFKLGILSSLGANSTNEGTQSVSSSNHLRFIVPVDYVVMNRGRCKQSGDWNQIAGKM